MFTCERGQRGDVYIEPGKAIFDEVAELVHACRAAWQAQDPTINGITAVHINRFVDALWDPARDPRPGRPRRGR